MRFLMRRFAEMVALSRTPSSRSRFFVLCRTERPRHHSSSKMKDVCKHSESRRKTRDSSRTIVCVMAPLWAPLSSTTQCIRTSCTFLSDLRPGNRWFSTASPTQRLQMKNATSNKTWWVAKMAPAMAPRFLNQVSWSKTKRRKSFWMVSSKSRRKLWASESKDAWWKRQLSVWRDFRWKPSWTRKLSGIHIL